MIIDTLFSQIGQLNQVFSGEKEGGIVILL